MIAERAVPTTWGAWPPSLERVNEVMAWGLRKALILGAEFDGGQALTVRLADRNRMGPEHLDAEYVIVGTISAEPPSLDVPRRTWVVVWHPETDDVAMQIVSPAAAALVI